MPTSVRLESTCTADRRGSTERSSASGAFSTPLVSVRRSLAIRMDDGTELTAGPGDITSLPSGHDAWVVGDEPVIVVDWYGASNFARS